MKYWRSCSFYLQNLNLIASVKTHFTRNFFIIATVLAISIYPHFARGSSGPGIDAPESEMGWYLEHSREIIYIPMKLAIRYGKGCRSFLIK